MELTDWIALAVFFVLGFALGWRINNAFHVAAIKQLLTELGVSDRQLMKVAKDIATELGPEAQAKIRALEERANDGLEQIEIKVEKHGEVLYAFRKDNDAFLGQGTNKDQLIEAMSKRMKNVRLTVVEGDEYMKAEA